MAIRFFFVFGKHRITLNVTAVCPCQSASIKEYLILCACAYNIQNLFFLYVPVKIMAVLSFSFNYSLNSQPYTSLCYHREPIIRSLKSSVPWTRSHSNIPGASKEKHDFSESE